MLVLYNSQNRKKEAFDNLYNKVGMYVCGITPYSVTHLGHAFTYTFFDVLARYLRYLGYTITYVQNVTDIIDEDILKARKRKGKPWRKFLEENTEQFLEDMRWLGNAQSDYYVRATDHIPEMQAIIKKLLQKGFAYERQGSVYFEIAKDKNYGKLSNLSRRQMLPIANERGNDPADPSKKHPLDFVLWQKAKRGEPRWRPAPSGRGSPRLQAGRPGWHIECSAMSTKYLGQPFAIHGGGGDLLFPHHESEIAQSENAPFDSARGKQPMAKYWLHVAMLRYQGKKMSKSLGNLVLIENLKKEYNANTVRLALLLHHYRTAWECTHRDLQKAKKLNAVLQQVWLLQSGAGKKLDFAKERNAFFAAMDDDMNTPKVLKTTEQLAQKMYKAPRNANLADAKAFLMQVFHILGLSMEFS